MAWSRAADIGASERVGRAPDSPCRRWHLPVLPSPLPCLPVLCTFRSCPLPSTFRLLSILIYRAMSCTRPRFPVLLHSLDCHLPSPVLCLALCRAAPCSAGTLRLHPCLTVLLRSDAFRAAMRFICLASKHHPSPGALTVCGDPPMAIEPSTRNTHLLAGRRWQKTQRDTTCGPDRVRGGRGSGDGGLDVCAIVLKEHLLSLVWVQARGGRSSGKTGPHSCLMHQALTVWFALSPQEIMRSHSPPTEEIMRSHQPPTEPYVD